MVEMTNYYKNRIAAANIAPISLLKEGTSSFFQTVRMFLFRNDHVKVSDFRTQAQDQFQSTEVYLLNKHTAEQGRAE